MGTSSFIQCEMLTGIHLEEGWHCSSQWAGSRPVCLSTVFFFMGISHWTLAGIHGRVTESEGPRCVSWLISFFCTKIGLPTAGLPDLVRHFSNLLICVRAHTDSPVCSHTLLRADFCRYWIFLPALPCTWNLCLLCSLLPRFLLSVFTVPGSGGRCRQESRAVCWISESVTRKLLLWYPTQCDLVRQKDSFY